MPWRLVWRNLGAHWLRSLLTFLSVALAVFLLCVLRGAVMSLTSVVEKSANNRLWVQSAVSLYVDLPLAYESKIAAVDGIESVSRFQWFGGEYQDHPEFPAQFAIDADKFLRTFPEIEIAEGSYDAFARNRTGCIVGHDMARALDLKLGSKLPLIGKIFPRTDGGAWQFTIEAIYQSKVPTQDMRTVWFHYDYLRESIEQGAAQGMPGVGVFLVAIKPGVEPTRVMADIDALFANGPQRVQTTTEAEFNRQFVAMLGNVPGLLGIIGAAVLFAIAFAVLNTMLMASRERTRDVGVMKALGFGGGAVMGVLLAESLLLCGAAGLFGVGLARLTERGLQALTAQFMPGYEVSPAIIALGLGIALGIGLLAGLLPGWQLKRLRPVVALRAQA
jgi:putative ABC transport system permease protein